MVEVPGALPRPPVAPHLRYDPRECVRTARGQKFPPHHTVSQIVIISPEPSQSVIRYPVNTEGRDFVVGDVHGCFSLLDTELAARGYDPTRDRLFSVGDLIDRGKESTAVLEVVQRQRIQAVRGNHEQMIHAWATTGGPERYRTRRAAPDADHPPEPVYGNASIRSLLSNGAEWFIDLCGDDGDRAHEKACRIASYFGALPYAIEIETAYGRIGIVHADVPAESWTGLLHRLEVGQCQPTREAMLWGRGRWLRQEAAPHIDGVTAVIVGHTAGRAVVQRCNVINIDTGAVYGNTLTILDLADVPERLARGDSPVTVRLG
jgi:serine/threonine protein phosphatase 1